MKSHGLRLVLGIAVAALLCGFGTFNAEGGGKKKGTAVNYGPILAEMQETRVLLQNAKHDYDGYRAKAVHDLGKAMHALDPNHSHKLPKVADPGNGENQAQSDALLNQAGKQVQTIISQLTTGTATPATTSAVKHMQDSLGHLNTALKIK
jgi:hypothetical protein